MSAQNPPIFWSNKHKQGANLDYGDIAVNKTLNKSCLHGAYILVMICLITQNNIQGP